MIPIIAKILRNSVTGYPFTNFEKQILKYMALREIGERVACHRISSLFHDVGCDLEGNAASNAHRSRTLLFVRSDGTLGRLTFSRWDAQVIVHANFRNAKYAVDSLDVPFEAGSNLARLGRYLARFQRSG